MSSTADKLIEDYLKRLDANLGDVPRARRRELIEEISGHIAEARSSLDPQDEAGIRTLLDRLGDPEEIAAAATERGTRPSKAGWKEVAALVLLPVGGVILPVLGWLVGIVLLWISDVWSTRDKLIGTFLFPGGLLLPLALGVFAEEGGGCGGTVVSPRLSPEPNIAGCGASGTAFWEIALVVTLILVPLLTTAYLARRMRRMSVAIA